jgi:hypothetical protein
MQEQYFNKYGRKIWENGYTVLPLQPNTKVPGSFDGGKWRGFDDWASYCAKPNIGLEIDAWENWPNAGICVPLGTLVAVDIDIENDEELSDNIERVARSTLGDTQVMRIGKYPKKMLFYRNSNPIKKMRLGPIEILGSGQQAAAHGIHPDTRAPYTWPHKKLYEVRFKDLIEVTESQLKNFLEFAQPYLPEQEQKTAKIYAPGSYTTNDMLSGDLEAITDALKWITNNDLHYDEWMRVLMSVKGALGDAGETVFLAWSGTSVKDVVEISQRSFRMAQPTMTGAGTIYHLAQTSGWNPPPSIHFNEEKKSIAETLDQDLKWIDGFINNAEHGSENAEIEAKKPLEVKESQDDTAFPEECLNVDGLLGEMCKWINQTAVIHQPVMALMNSVAALSTVYGRKFYLEDRATRTNVMVLLLANTATGKDHSRSRIKELFAASNGDRLMMGDVLNSEPGILRALSDQPRRLAMVDEFGQFLSVINSKNATSHQAGIVAALMKLYSSSGSIYHGADYADEGREAKRIHFPSLSVYGTTTLADFENNLTDKNLASGFLNRFMTIPIFKSNRKIQKTRKTDAPPHLIDAMKTAIEFDIRGDGNLEGVEAEGATSTPTSPVFWDEGLDDLREEIDHQFEMAMARADNGDPLGNLWGRYVENIYKLSMIRALSRSIFRPVITRADLEWSRKIMDWSVARTAEMIEENASNSFAEADIKKVLGYIKQTGEKGIKHGDLVKKLWRMSANNRKNAISTLLESEQVSAEQVDGTHGNKKILYKVI